MLKILFAIGQLSFCILYSLPNFISLDVMRSRDHVIPLYNDAREAMGLKRAVKWTDITNDIETVQRLIDTYGEIDRVEAFLGGLAEDHVKGSDLGELFYKSFYDQVRKCT